MPPDPGMIRVQVRIKFVIDNVNPISTDITEEILPQTPPRVLTLDNHYFPSDDYAKEIENENHDEVLTLSENNIHLYNNMHTSQSSVNLDQSVNARDYTANWK